MAWLDRIKICGIRSFGPEEGDVQEIRFQKPMTLILGENGCGKSTIIECLRYLTAQKEPPGKGTFVHDPYLTLRSTVKAFVKLRICDTKGNRIDLCRQLQTTRTKKTLTTKSLDNVITRSTKGSKEKHSISNRCVDFTYEISRIFGVSRAILENVIFCTQEEAHWPLDTDQKLKEKFDQIFNLDKFNKFGCKIREKVKKMKEACKMSDVQIKYLEGNKKMAADKRREVEKTKLQINECEKESAELDKSLEPIERGLKEIYEREMELSKNHTTKEMKKAELNQVKSYVAELRSRIGMEFEGSDEELKNVLTNFKNQLSVRQNEISKLEENINECNRQESKLSKELMSEQGKVGQLEKEEEINKERVNDRNRCLNTLAIQLDMDASELSQGSEDSVEYLLSRVEVEVKTKEENIVKLKQKYAKEESDIQNEIDRLREKTLSLKNEVKNKERSISERQMEIAKIKKELNEIVQSVSKLSKIEAQIAKANKRIEELHNSVDTDELKKRIQSTLNRRDKAEDRLSEVEEVVKKLQQNASVSAELDIQRELMSNKESDIRRMLNKHEDSLTHLLGEVPLSGFKTAMQNQIDKLRRTIRELTTTRTRKERELTELEMRRKHQKEQIRLKEEKLRSFEEEIYEECGTDDFDDTVTNLQSQIDDLQDVKGTLSSSEFMYQRYIQALQKPQPCCPLCHRDFTRQSEAQVLAEELSSKVREVPSKLLENKNELEEKQKKFNKLLTLRSKQDQIVTLRTVTLPDMRSELESIEASLKRIKKEFEDIGNQIQGPQSDEATCSSLQGDMALLDQLQLEKKKIGWEMDKLETRLGSAGKGESNLEELFKEQDILRKDVREARKLLEELQTNLNTHNEELQKEQESKSKLMEEINKIHGGAGQKKQLEDRYNELQGYEISGTQDLTTLKEELNESTRCLNDAISKRNMQKERNADEIERQSKTLNAFQKQLQDIQTANNHVKAFTNRGITRKLESAQTQIKKLEKELHWAKTEREKTIKTINDIKRDLSNQETRERELEDNVKYRERVKYSEELRKEVEELERKYGNINFDDLLSEKKKLKMKEEAVERKKAVLQGRIGELNVRVDQLQRELMGKMLKNAEEEHQTELQKLVTVKALIKDLERYGGALEHAMMSYHKQKMSQVNAIIREYWRKIYQGNDIDYIEIQTDTVISTDKRRNYTYKVIQRKNDVFLDLRNRCSAGQKMLASLIIRMALADTFSGNCGILTLDEPTTNLDRKNIKNLARMLTELSEVKRDFTKTHFQLIIITHDEEFLRELVDIDAVSDYVHVRRDLRGKTVVTREVFDGSLPRIGQVSRIRPPQQESDAFVYD